MKRKFISIISLLLLVGAITVFNSCNKPEDLMTSEVKTGGLVEAVNANIPYKLGNTPTVSLSISVPVGPAITKVVLYKKFYSTADTAWTNNVLLTEISISGGNATAAVDASKDVTYAELISGLLLEGAALPADENLLSIGDYFEITLVSIMADDSRSILNNSKINISIANIYAGNYQCVGTFEHPTAGTRPVNEEKFLTPLDAFSCWANAGDLGSAGYFVKVSVDPVTKAVTCSTSPNSDIDMANFPGEDSYYDPATGEFHLSYFYVGGSGNRVMREVWTPISK